MHPNTPTFILGLNRFTALYFSKRLRIVCSALSRMEQVLTKTKSASSKIVVVLYPFLDKIEATISESEKFMAQP